MSKVATYGVRYAHIVHRKEESG